VLRSYLRLGLFALGLLIGVQVPGFIQNYADRVEAHRLESEQGLTGFRDTAQRFFKGDLAALVAHYRVSDDPVFRSDADSLNLLLERSSRWNAQWLAMQSPWYARAWHVLVAADRELLAETHQAYRYQVLLAPEAIAWGVSCALLLAWLIESLLLLGGRLFGLGRSKPLPARHWR
jgi:hypothetical protein